VVGDPLTTPVPARRHRGLARVTIRTVRRANQRRGPNPPVRVVETTVKRQYRADLL
jgi:hypothetical protein